MLLAGVGALCGLAGLRLALSRDESAIIKVIYKRLPGSSWMTPACASLLTTCGGSTWSRAAACTCSMPPVHCTPTRPWRLTTASTTRCIMARIASPPNTCCRVISSATAPTRAAQYGSLGYYDATVPCNNPFARKMAGPPPTYPGTLSMNAELNPSTLTNVEATCRFCGSPQRHRRRPRHVAAVRELIAADQLNRMEPFYPLHAWSAKCWLVQLEQYVGAGQTSSRSTPTSRRTRTAGCSTPASTPC